MRKISIYKWILIVILAFPYWVSAASFNYTCADFNASGGGVSCSGSTVTFTGAGTGYVLDNTGGNFNLTNGNTYYLSATVVTSGGGFNWCSMNATNNSNGKGETVTIVDSSLTISGDVGAAQGIIISDSGRTGSCNNSPIGAVTSQTIDISDICIADAVDECVVPGDPPSGNGTTSTTTISIVYNPTQDVGIGMLLFIATMAIVIFFFKT